MTAHVQSHLGGKPTGNLNHPCDVHQKLAQLERPGAKVIEIGHPL